MQQGGDPQRPPQQGSPPPFFNPQGPQTPPPHHQPPHGSPVNPQFKRMIMPPFLFNYIFFSHYFLNKLHI